MFQGKGIQRLSAILHKQQQYPLTIRCEQDSEPSNQLNNKVISGKLMCTKQVHIFKCREISEGKGMGQRQALRHQNDT